MCGVSGPELIIVVVAAVIVLGPDRLPDVMRMVGRLLREVRKITGDLGKMTDEVTSGVSVEDLKRQLREEMGVERVRERRREVESEIDEIRSRLKARLNDEAQPTSAEQRELRQKFGTAADSIEPPAGGDDDVEATPVAESEPSPPPVSIRPAAGTVSADAPLDDDAPAPGADDE